MTKKEYLSWLANIFYWYTRYLSNRSAAKEARLSSQNFLSRHRKVFERIEIGCSLSPEELVAKGFDTKDIIKIIDFIYDSLGIRDVRFGIRWSEAVNAKGEVDLSFYKPYLKHLLSGKFSICLNVGPIKTFRWPEQHVPQQILRSFKDLPDKGTCLEQKDPLIEYALDYLRNLVESLKQNFSAQELNYVTCIQPENEPLKQFGEYGWLLNPEYLKNLILYFHKVFPNRSYMLSSSGCLQATKIQTIFSEIIRNVSTLFSQLVMGINYYYEFPGKSTLPVFKEFDDILFSQKKRNLCKENIEFSESIGYKIEIAEAQMEGWGTNIQTPGNSIREFRYVILRCASHLLNLKQVMSIIRVWGIENLAVAWIRGNLNKDQKKIIYLIKEINNI